MKTIDGILACVLGGLVGILMDDFLHGAGVIIPFYQKILVVLVFAAVSLACFWLAGVIGRKFSWVLQAAKFFLVGAGATVIDVKAFELSYWALSLLVPASLVISKSLSFIIATLLKYLGNKYWTFERYQKEQGWQAIAKFFAIDALGLLINVAGFWWLAQVVGPQFGIPLAIWLKLSIILVALATAVFNFAGYKFFVFKHKNTA